MRQGPSMLLYYCILQYIIGLLGVIVGLHTHVPVSRAYAHQCVHAETIMTFSSSSSSSSSSKNKNGNWREANRSLRSCFSHRLPHEMEWPLLKHVDFQEAKVRAPPQLELRFFKF